MKIGVGDIIHVVGQRGRHYTGVVTVIHDTSADAEHSKVYLEYRCAFNQGIHVAYPDKCRVIKRAKKISNRSIVLCREHEHGASECKCPPGCTCFSVHTR